jgi:Transposase DDE domain
LMGHALRKALGVIARQQGWGLAEGTAALAAQAGAGVLDGSSLKAALDTDWDDPAAREHALGVVLAALEQVEGLVATHPQVPLAAVAAVAAARQIREQDVQASPEGMVRLWRGVAKDRRISVEDEHMRHGRKSRSTLIDGYKRHVLCDLDSGLVPAVGITPANVPEATVTGDIAADLAAQDLTLVELHIDRAYLASTMVRERGQDLAIYCKAWRVHNAGRFTKADFAIDFDTRQLTCPNQVVMAFEPGRSVQFPKATCAACPLRVRCTTSSSGRSVTVHPDEALLVELRQRQQTPQGRARLRERTKVEHSLAHIGHWQGRRARYLGPRKNLFDLRRAAVVHNLHVIARQPPHSQQAA